MSKGKKQGHGYPVETHTGVDFKVLDEEKKKALKAKAREIAEKEAKEKAEEEYLKQAIIEAEAELAKESGVVTNEEMVYHTVNLCSAAKSHLINGKEYFHNQTYHVPKSLADCMRDTEFRGWIQEDIRKGNNRNEYGYKERNGIISGSGVVMA